MALTWLTPRRQTRRVPLFLIATVSLLTAQAPGPPPSLTPRDSAFHALNRLAYSARPGEADSVARFGVMKWIERQLDADHVPDARLAERERQFKILDYDRADLAGRTVGAAVARGDGRLLDESLQRVRRQGRRSLPVAFLYRGNDSAAGAGKVRRLADRHGAKSGDALLSRQCAKRCAGLRASDDAPIQS